MSLSSDVAQGNKERQRELTGQFIPSLPELITRTTRTHKLTKECREREKGEVLMRFRTFAERSTWKKARISRELGVSLSTVDRWLHGSDKIMLASILEIRRFLEEREREMNHGLDEG